MGEKLLENMYLRVLNAKHIRIQRVLRQYNIVIIIITLL